VLDIEYFSIGLQS